MLDHVKYAGHEKRESQKRQNEQDESAEQIRLLAEQNAQYQKQITELLKQLIGKEK